LRGSASERLARGKIWSMTNPVDIAHAVLIQLAEQVRKLPPELIVQLYEGTARLEIVPKGGRVAAAAKRTGKPARTFDVDQIRDDLAKINDRAAASRYLEDLKVTVPQLVSLADALGIPIPRKPKRDEAVRLVVQWTVGRRVDTDAVSQPAPSRF
jgi:hypothetical protein